MEVEKGEFCTSSIVSLDLTIGEKQQKKIQKVLESTKYIYHVLDNVGFWLGALAVDKLQAYHEVYVNHSMRQAIELFVFLVSAAME